MVPNKRIQIGISLALLVYMSNVQGFFESRENRIEIGIRLKGESEKERLGDAYNHKEMQKMCSEQWAKVFSDTHAQTCLILSLKAT